MLTFIENVKKAIYKRSGFERHKAMPVKKLILKTSYERMYSFLKHVSKKNKRARIYHVSDLGTILYFPVKTSSSLYYDLRNQASKLGVSQILHVDYRKDERTVYACLEDL